MRYVYVCVQQHLLVTVRQQSGVPITLLMSSASSFLQPTCETPDADGYAPLQTAAEEHKERSPKPPEKPSDCEVGGHVHMTATSCTWVTLEQVGH